MENDAKAMTTKELTEVVSKLLEREEQRVTREDRQRRKLARQKHRERDALVSRMMRSIEVIKWCIVGIVTSMFLSLVVLIVVVLQIREEVERVKVEAEKIMVQVHEIQDEAERIREKIRHPLEALGGTLGRRLEAEIGGLIGSGEN